MKSIITAKYDNINAKNLEVTFFKNATWSISNYDFRSLLNMFYFIERKMKDYSLHSVSVFGLTVAYSIADNIWHIDKGGKHEHKETMFHHCYFYIKTMLNIDTEEVTK